MPIMFLTSILYMVLILQYGRHRFHPCRKLIGELCIEISNGESKLAAARCLDRFDGKSCDLILRRVPVSVRRDFDCNFNHEASDSRKSRIVHRNAQYSPLRAEWSARLLDLLQPVDDV